MHTLGVQMCTSVAASPYAFTMQWVLRLLHVVGVHVEDFPTLAH